MLEHVLQSEIDSLNDQLQAQQEPFDELWSARTHISGEIFLVSLRIHALRVLRVVGSLATNGEHSVWGGVYDNLHTVVALQSIALDTDVHGESLMCRPASEYHDMKSGAKERFVAGKLVFQGAWNALEMAGNLLSTGMVNATIQAIRHQLAKGSYRPFFGLREALFDAHRLVACYIDTEHVAYREAIASGNYLCVATEYLRQFRNGILHGKIAETISFDCQENSEYGAPNLQTELFHTQIRLILFLLQAVIVRLEDRHIMIWPNDGDYVEEIIYGLQKENSIETDGAWGDDIPLTLFADQKYIDQI